MRNKFFRINATKKPQKTKKPKPTKYTEPEPATTTKKEPENVYDEDATAGTDDMDNIYAPDSEVKGDPHFMVRSPGEDAVCFDADAPPGVQVPLVFDPVTGLSISGTIQHRETLNRTVIDTLYIMTPRGVTIHVNHDGLSVDGYQNPFKQVHPKVWNIIN